MSSENKSVCDLSLVIPCLNEEDAIPIFYTESSKIVQGLRDEHKITSWEYIFVDDGSTDKTRDVLRSLCEEDSNVHYISFSRNFGKESALYAGLEKTRGKYIATLDVDLQDPPSLIPQMLEIVQSGKVECAASRRVTRKGEPPVRSFFAKNFYKIMGHLSDVKVVGGARDFRVMTRKYVEAVLSLKEKNRFSKGIFPWVGFKTEWFEFENVARSAGKTKWSFWNLFLYSIDGMIGFSTKPLAIASVLGVLSIAIALAIICFIVVRKIIFDDPVAGWTSTICIILFLGGVQLFSVGILGQYIAKIYTEIKSRPLYIVEEER